MNGKNYKKEDFISIHSYSHNHYLKLCWAGV